MTLEEVWEEVLLEKENYPLHLKLLANLSLLFTNRKGYTWISLRKEK